MRVLIIPYAVHRNPIEWENPNDFIPERFRTGENFRTEKSAADIKSGKSDDVPIYTQFGYIPFSAGPRG